MEKSSAWRCSCLVTQCPLRPCATRERAPSERGSASGAPTVYYPAGERLAVLLALNLAISIGVGKQYNTPEDREYTPLSALHLYIAQYQISQWTKWQNVLSKQ